MLIVVTIIGILVTLAQPSFNRAVTAAKEATLKENLFVLRDVIDQYFADNNRYPDSLNELVDELLQDVGPAFYKRVDLRLSHPIAKDRMAHYLVDCAPAEIGGSKVGDINKVDGVKYLIADGSWLLIRPSGTEPVLRVYAEGRSTGMVKALLGFGEEVAASIS